MLVDLHGSSACDGLCKTCVGSLFCDQILAIYLFLSVTATFGRFDSGKSLCKPNENLVRRNRLET
jgi:hypothetical protein